jgi:hypothetical protein
MARKQQHHDEAVRAAASALADAQEALGKAARFAAYVRGWFDDPKNCPRATKERDAAKVAQAKCNDALAGLMDTFPDRVLFPDIPATGKRA